MKLRVLANAAVYMETEEKGLLIDGFIAGYDGFDLMPEATRDAIMEGKSPFDHINGILFTHNHPDHYCKETVEQFCHKHPQVKASFSKDLEPYREDYCLKESKDFEGLIYGQTEGMALARLSCKHMFYSSEEVTHDVLCFQIEGKRILITGDADPVGLKKRFEHETGLADQLKEIGVYPWDFAIVNPYFLYMKPGRNFLKQEGIQQLAVYHIPIACEDSLRYHDILRLGLARCGEDFQIQVCDEWNKDVKIILA